MKKWDVIICGASVSGLYSGYALAKRGLSVLIIDRRDEIGTPVRCGEATGNRSEIERFIPWDSSYIACELTGIAVHINGEETLSTNVPDAGVILHRDRFEQFIAKCAEESGAQILLNTVVNKLIKTENRFTAVETSAGIFEAAYFVGADGAESFLGRESGLTASLKPRDAYTALQYRLKSDRWNDGKMHFFAGTHTIPNGYIWVFPKSDGEISVGAGLFGSHIKGEKAAVYLDRFIESYFPECEKSMLITGCAPICAAPKSLHSQNLVIVGDAARMVNPLTAGGIMNALEAADVMCNVLYDSHKTGSIQNLSRYSRIMAGKPRIIQKVFYVLKELYAESTDAELLQMVKVGGRFLEKEDRSKPFSLPLSALIPLAGLYASRFLKWVPWLIRS